MFKVKDVWGIVAGIFVLIMVYLILEHGTVAIGLTQQGTTSGVNFIKALQGR